MLGYYLLVTARVRQLEIAEQLRQRAESDLLNWIRYHVEQKKPITVSEQTMRLVLPQRHGDSRAQMANWAIQHKLRYSFEYEWVPGSNERQRYLTGVTFR